MFPERQDTVEFELQEDNNAEHWNLLSQTLKCGRAKSNHVRVNIIGNQGASETTIISRLHGKDAQTNIGNPAMHWKQVK